MPESKAEYEWQTAVIHAALGLSSLAACLPAMWGANLPFWVGLLMSGLTNVLIAWEKWDVWRKGRV